MTVATVALMATAGAFASSVDNVENSRRVTEAAIFAETVLEDISAQEYDVLLALDGNQLFDGDTQDESSFLADIIVFQAAVNLRQIRVVVSDIRTNRELGRVSLLRSES